ncbi:MAG: hypothetical protein U0Q07_02240 [Acidimicrobiales bacterium]
MRARRPHLLVLAAAIAAVAAGCGREPAPVRTPDRATEIVSVTLFLDPARTDCVKQRFTSDPSLAAALNPGPDDLPSAAQRRRFTQAMRECIPPDVLADAAGRIVLSALPGSSDESLACVKGRIVAMSTADQDTLLVGSVNPPAVQLDLARVLTDQLTVPCHLDALVDPSGGTAVPGPAGPVASTVPGGGSGATVVTR